MKFTDLFKIEDKIIRLPGLYTLWTIIFVANLVSLFVDDTTGPVRNFNIIANGFSVIYPAAASINNIYGNGLPSTVLVSAGPLHQYLFWMLFAFFGGKDVLSDSELGTMNWISLIVVGGFSADMWIKTWYVALNRDKYLEYVKENTPNNVSDIP
tara:strand:- start:441 stop:902 length:462 start_codon:yes stop_codon:yes gene_type:complete